MSASRRMQGGTQTAGQDLEPTAAEKRASILRAAYTQFARYGYRRTSMEDIARETGMSRAFLYLHFKNKDEIFRQLAESLHDDIWQGIQQALAAPGPVAERVASALAEKGVHTLQIVSDSEHAQEIFDAGGRLGPDLAADFDERFHRALAQALKDADDRGEIDLSLADLTPAAASELLRFASYGLKSDGVGVAVFRRRVGQLTKVFFGALGPTAAA